MLFIEKKTSAARRWCGATTRFTSRIVAVSSPSSAVSSAVPVAAGRLGSQRWMAASNARSTARYGGSVVAARLSNANITCSVIHVMVKKKMHTEMRRLSSSDM